MATEFGIWILKDAYRNWPVLPPPILASLGLENNKKMALENKPFFPSLTKFARKGQVKIIICSIKTLFDI
ncbi:hypothetical protein EBQ26_02500 [Allofranklinella schreckenbergeri]|uniref:Uncharacterized protein n=1 Tax=Allofranklinella schreckenbergeri TaxID=1076744 RepID=A0A3M6QC88_9BURK|nr:hypothetical protein EBQ26_02500 [Allofranklinella schreckenbergeri]